MAATNPVAASLQHPDATRGVGLAGTLNLLVAPNPPGSEQGSPTGDDHRVYQTTPHSVRRYGVTA